ncbi:MAG: hypothetical protein V8R08_00900 [Coriobacteriales bacterium]
MTTPNMSQRVTEAAVGCRGDEAGQLHAQQDEDDAVEDEAEGVPDALGLHALARGLGRVTVGRSEMTMPAMTTAMTAPM